MAGLRGNIAWLMAAKQTAKGTAATPDADTTYKMALSGGSVSPLRNTDNLSETDASRDRGVAYVVSSGVQGSPEFYVRDVPVGFWLWATLGADAVTGTDPRFVHVLTPANTLPYITCWNDVGDTLYEQFTDCRVGSVEIAADAGAPLVSTITLMGVNSTRLTAAPDASEPIAVQAGPVYNFNNASVTLGGSATALVRSFDLTIQNNLTSQQTDDVQPYDIAEGIREVDLSFDMIFEDLREYNRFNYGGATGTEISPDIFTTSASFNFALGADNSIQFDLPSIAYQEFPVEPNANGDPIVVSVRAVAQRGDDPVVTATVRNTVATY